MATRLLELELFGWRCCFMMMMVMEMLMPRKVYLCFMAEEFHTQASLCAHELGCDLHTQQVGKWCAIILTLTQERNNVCNRSFLRLIRILFDRKCSDRKSNCIKDHIVHLLS